MSDIHTTKLVPAGPQQQEQQAKHMQFSLVGLPMPMKTHKAGVQRPWAAGAAASRQRPAATPAQQNLQ
eukprot:2503790-Rhodomonas_salina.1